jgi:hypothetical protein
MRQITGRTDALAWMNAERLNLHAAAGYATASHSLGSLGKGRKRMSATRLAELTASLGQQDQFLSDRADSWIAAYTRFVGERADGYPGMPAPVKLRAPVISRAFIVIFGVVWCGFVTLALVAAIGSGSPGAMIPLIMLCFGATFMTRIFILTVVADQRGLLVRNLFRTRQFGWGQVEDFRIGASSGFRGRKSIYVLLRDGEILPLEVTNPRFYGPTAKLPGYLDQLRSWVPQYS